MLRLLQFVSVSGLPLAADQASPERDVDREAHRATLPGLRLGPVRGVAAQPAANGAASSPPLHVLPAAEGDLQDVRLHRLSRCELTSPEP